MLSTRRRIAPWLLACAAAAVPLEADVVMSLRTTDFSSPSPEVENTRMAIRPSAGEQAGQLKMDITSPRGEAAEAPREPRRNHTLVFHGGESPSITVVDHRKKSFSIIDRESMAVFSTELRMMAQATSMRIGSLPPEQREIVQKMLDNQYGPDRSTPRLAAGTMVKTSGRETLSGLPCVKYELFQRGEKLREVWVAPAAAVRGGEPALALLREMSDFYGTLMASFERIAPAFVGGLRPDESPFEDLRRMNGFPVLTRNFAGGRIKTEIALLSVTEQQLSAGELEPPEGYSPAESMTR